MEFTDSVPAFGWLNWIGHSVRAHNGDTFCLMVGNGYSAKMTLLSWFYGHKFRLFSIISKVPLHMLNHIALSQLSHLSQSLLTFIPFQSLFPRIEHKIITEWNDTVLSTNQTRALTVFIPNPNPDGVPFHSDHFHSPNQTQSNYIDGKLLDKDLYWCNAYQQPTMSDVIEQL